MSSITTREAKKEDLNILLEFEQGVIAAEKPFDSFLKREAITYYNIEELITSEKVHLVVAILEKEIVGSGYVRIEKSKSYHKNKLHGYIGFIYVKPTHRRKGISTIVLESLKEWGKNKGINELRLDVYNNNIAAINSYERFGFNKSLLNMRMEI